MSMPRIGAWAAGMMLAAAPALAHAAASSDQQQGMAIFQHGGHGIPACAGCHGSQARGGMGPRLAGLGHAYIVRQLHDFSSGARQSRIMENVARRLDATTMRQVAAWIAALKPRLPSRTPRIESPTLKLLTEGDWSRSVPACIDCHAGALMGDGDEIPALAGQQRGYIAKRLRWFKALKTPPNPPAGIMSNVAGQLSDQEINDLAKALSELNGTAVSSLKKENSGEVASHAAIKKRRKIAPASAALPESRPLAEAIRHGEQIFMNTPEQASRYVGKNARLSCVHCHLNRGRLATAAPMWAAAIRYPLYRKKNHRVNTLAMRIQGCFRYSLNGAPPPPNSHTMVDLIAYIHWLARGQTIGAKPIAHGFPSITKAALPPDKLRGARLFRMRCALCHGQDGQGKVRSKKVLFPPLWGAHSFNWGAGMHRIDKAAAFIKANMPYGAGNSLNTQDAWDIAAYVESHPRPEDPRFTGNIPETIRRFHSHRDVDFYATLHSQD